jgi:hypothetical protein
MSQLTFAEAEYEVKKRKTRREKFLERMDALLPWKKMERQLANFTVLEDNPLTVPADKIKDIAVWGTVHEGRVMPVQKDNPKKLAIPRLPEYFSPSAATVSPLVGYTAHSHTHGPSCAGHLGKRIAEILFPPVHLTKAEPGLSSVPGQKP